jgi:hypothetical protein
MSGERADALALAGPWPLIGREPELQAIARAWAERTCAGVAIIAGAGIGKLRLAREALAAAEREGGFA